MEALHLTQELQGSVDDDLVASNSLGLDQPADQEDQDAELVLAALSPTGVVSEKSEAVSSSDDSTPGTTATNATKFYTPPAQQHTQQKSMSADDGSQDQQPDSSDVVSVQSFQHIIQNGLQVKALDLQNHQRVVQIPLLVKGSYVLPNKQPWVVNDFLLERIEANFKNNVLGFAPPLYKGHEHLYSLEEPPAHGFMFDCFRDGDVLYSLFEVVNPNTYEEINLGYYRHASVEYWTYAQDRRTGEEVGALLTAVALTNSPFIADMPTNQILNRLQNSLDRSDLGCILASHKVVLSLMPEQTSKPASQSVSLQQSNQMDEQTIKEMAALKAEAERLRLEVEQARSEAATTKQILSQIHLNNLQQGIDRLALSAELKQKAFSLVTADGLSEQFQNSFVELLAEVLANADELQKRTSQYGVSSPTALEVEAPRPYQQIIQRNRQGKKTNSKNQQA